MRKISIISCVNDNKKYDRMRLSLDGCLPNYVIHFNPVYGETTMSGGYNKGLTASFKNEDVFVYVHQDVVFINSEFMEKAIDLLNSGKLDMVGVVGTKKLPESLIFWEGQCYGRVLEDRGAGPNLLNFGYPNDDEFFEVDMIDGLIMVTNRAMDWPNSPGFHFYDMLMCQKFVKRGLKVGVPNHSGMSILHEIGSREFNSTEYLRARDEARFTLNAVS